MTGSITAPAERAWRYPPAPREEVVETWHGVPVADPYRWLEDPYADRTRSWVAAQNQLTADYLAGLPARSWFVDQLTRTLGRPHAGVPRKRGGRYLRWHNDGRQQQDSVQIAGSLPELLAGGRVLVDPAEFDAGGGVSIADVSISPDGRYAAYGLSEAGSDWIEWRVREVDTGADTGDRLSRGKFSTAEWLPDSRSFLYWAYPEQERPSGEDATALGAGKLLRHRLGTGQAADGVVYHHPEAPRERPYAKVTEDGRWLVLAISLGTARRNRLVVRRIGADGNLGDDLVVVAEPTALFDPAGSDGDLLYLRTDQGAERYRLMAVDLAGLAAGAGEAAWRELIAEQPAVLADIQRAGDGFLAVYLEDAAHRVYRLDRDGGRRMELRLPGPVSVLERSVRAGDPEAFLGTTTFVDDLRGHRIDLAEGTVESLPTEAPSRTAGVVTSRGWAVSADGTEVPYFLVRRADLPPDSPRPTLLFGYGGFNQPMTPSYKPGWPAWVEAGGVLVVANLRGGGEFGREWYEAGTRERKQNVFDDFIAVADQLVATGVTTRDQLAVHGRSNGGLLIGAVMTQRPDLAAVALPMVGVLDMLRFHRFTIGWAWIADYGDPEEPADFTTLYAYSPLHNLKPGTSYPATLVLTGDHDDRVVPAHSLKFAATLQHAQAGAAPVLARIETATGHGVGKPRSALVAETADMLGFAAAHTGLVPGGSAAAPAPGGARSAPAAGP